jgi:hypothetical protein
VGWLTPPEWLASACAAGVGASRVSEPAHGGVGSRTSCLAAQRAGRPPREGASVDAAQRHRDQWSLVVGDGIVWLACVEESSRGRWLSGRNPDAISKRGECPRPRHHQVRAPACALDDHGVGLELGALPAGECAELLVSRALWWRWRASCSWRSGDSSRPGSYQRGHGQAEDHAKASWRPRAGAMEGGSTASFRYRRIFRITSPWVMAAMIRSAPR